MKYPRHLFLELNRNLGPKHTPYWIISYTTSLNLLPSLNKRLFPLSPTLKKKTPTRSRANFISNLNYPTSTFFLRKERIYTKLKYSRCPQYDIVSGGLAALLAAFIGFLISEKFGLELLDSGDFYIAFMYGVFLVFALRPFIRITTVTQLEIQPFSLKHSLAFYKSAFAIACNACGFYKRNLPLFYYLSLNTLVKFIKENEYIRPTWRRFCYIIRFLKNYPKKVD